MGARSGEYTRNMYNELKRYIGLLVQKDRHLFDADMNDFSESVVRQFQRIAQHILGDIRTEDSWTCLSSVINNNFTVKGGDGTIEGAGRAWIGGLPSLLPSNKDFLNNVVNEPNIHARCTALAAQVLTDTAARFPVGGLIGRELIPNIEDTSDAGNPKSFTVISNTETTVTTDPADGDMRAVAQAGNRYRANLTTFSGDFNITDQPTSGASIGDDTIEDTVNWTSGSGWNDDDFNDGLFTIKGKTYRVTDHDATAGTITIAPQLEDNITTGDSYTLIDIRWDTVYLNTYLDEVSADEDSDLYHDLSGTQLEGARRLQVVQTIYVDEGDDAVQQIPNRYTDANGNEHYVSIIANFKRKDGDTLIPDDFIDNMDGQGFGSDAGGGGQGQGGSGGSGGDGGGIITVDVAALAQEVYDARLGAASLVERLTTKLFYSLVDVAADPTKTLGDIKLVFENLSDISAQQSSVFQSSTFSGATRFPTDKDQLKDVMQQFRVQASVAGPTDIDILAGAFITSSGITVKGAQTAIPSNSLGGAGNFRQVLVYLDDTGTVQLDETGTPDPSPAIPNYAHRFVIAQILVEHGEPIEDVDITQVQHYLYRIKRGTGNGLDADTLDGTHLITLVNDIADVQGNLDTHKIIGSADQKHVTASGYDAVVNANAPAAGNPFVTVNDLPARPTQEELIVLSSSGPQTPGGTFTVVTNGTPLTKTLDVKQDRWYRISYGAHFVTGSGAQDGVIAIEITGDSAAAFDAYLISPGITDYVAHSHKKLNYAYTDDNSDITLGGVIYLKAAADDNVTIEVHVKSSGNIVFAEDTPSHLQIVEQ